MPVLEETPKLPVELVRREGLFFARMPGPASEDLLEVALHGIASESDARAAAALLSRASVFLTGAGQSKSSIES